MKEMDASGVVIPKGLYLPVWYGEFNLLESFLYTHILDEDSHYI